jgi:glutamate synthase domain-containing protein 3
MSGGVVYALGRPLLNDDSVFAEAVGAAAAHELRTLLERHVRFTGSDVASSLLERWDVMQREFLVVVPRVQAVAVAEPEDDAAAAEG